MNKKLFIEKLYELVTKENMDIYKDLFNNNCSGDALDPYWKSSLAMYEKMSEESKKVFFNIIRQIEIDTVSNILALLDGVTVLEGQDGDFVLKLGDEKLNGDLQDLFLECDMED
jgi:hypothetical protein